MLTIKTKALPSKPSITLFKSPALPAIHKAGLIRASRYQAHVRKALPFIRKARAEGLTNAGEFATYLNTTAVPAPNGGSWNKSSVLRALRCAKKLGIDSGSLPRGEARKTWYVGSHSKGAAWKKDSLLKHTD